MDGTALLFYACDCGLLSAAAPRLGTPLLRIGVGALVGLAPPRCCP